MENVILYAKNLFVMHAVSTGLQSRASICCRCVSSLDEANISITEAQKSFFIAVVEAPVWDESARAVVDFFNAHGLAPIILTNEYTEAVRREVMGRRIMDYILKDEHFVDNLTQTVLRIRKNASEKILIVDDSPVSRKRIRDILELKRLNVLEAGDGCEAMRLLEENGDIGLVLTDFNMSGMNGVELIRAVRKNWPKDRLAVIGFSDADTPSLSARFLKHGANDFVFKTFIEDELYLRVVQNLETVGYIEELRKLSDTDGLTRLYNRRFLAAVGKKIFENVKRNNIRIAVAMLDIDHFKAVNDRYGHDVGDMAICHVAKVLAGAVRAGDVVSRYGGEEFCVIAVNVDKDTAPLMFERIRAGVEEKHIDVGDSEIKVTVSIGAAVTMGATLEEMIGLADKLLYAAKAGGRNRLVIG
jgi:diguanylate cyclase (GGDEF)-like protein